jgi:hypothetical protein
MEAKYPAVHLTKKGRKRKKGREESRGREREDRKGKERKGGRKYRVRRNSNALYCWEGRQDRK